jgi:beta-mannanase
MNLPSKTISASDYVTSWKDIYNIFKGTAGEGATNVAFVWCQSIDAANPSPPFYPGDSYVDWVATDGYDRQQNGLSAFASVFASWYDYWSKSETDSNGTVITNGSKPLMIGETGGIAPIPTENVGSYGLQVGSDQDAYIKGIEQDLDPNAIGNNGKSQYPEIKAVVYFSAAGPYGDWSLTNGTLSSGGASVNGLSSFITMADNHYFSYTNTNP